MRKGRKGQPPRPTELELEILGVLWRHGPGTVREVLARFNEGRKTEAGYTTILKMLQIMTEKKLVVRDDARRPQVYRARLTEEQTQQQLVTDLLDKVFGGSAKQLVMRALSARAAPDEELAQIEQILNKLEGDAT